MKTKSSGAGATLMKTKSSGAGATLMKTKSSGAGAASFLRRLRSPEIIYAVAYQQPATIIMVK